MKEFAENILITSEDLSDVVLACKYLLKNCKEAASFYDYISGRVSNDNINKFSVGYFPDDKNLDLLYSHVSKNTLEKLRLVYDWYAHDHSHILTSVKSFFNYHNIIFPYKDEYGNIIALAGRTLLFEPERKKLEIPKYKNTFFNKSLHLFGLYQAKQAIQTQENVIVVEGQIDCISCHQHGIHNVVALASSNLNRYQFYLLKKHTNDIYLLLDNDSAGKKAEERIINMFSKYANIYKIKLPKGFGDVDEYLQTGQKDIFESYTKKEPIVSNN